MKQHTVHTLPVQATQGLKTTTVHRGDVEWTTVSTAEP